MPARLGTALGLLLLCAISVLRVGRPPGPVPATAPDTVFSAERAMRYLDEIAVRPHAMGTADHDRVRDYIVAQLKSIGLDPQIQRTTAVGTRYQEAGRVQNILAWLPGNTSTGKAVLLMVHYDGVEAGPAASDDGAGAAALLETLRALRARRQPLSHDVIALFTDGEEAGLLGAAAFVREHAWAKDVAVVLNFEARGTTGRSFMFETGPGNLDAVRALRTAGDVSAGSVYATVYRTLPNDTDLSELAVLGLPALNFAFADGVERYHTSHDDVAHLNPGSLQHHGTQMLALAKTFASETLPRPTTGDGVFFDLPLLGLVVYPAALAVPLAILAVVMVVVLIGRVRRGIVAGALVTILAIVSSGLVAWAAAAGLALLHARVPWRGSPQWSGVYAIAIALLVIATTAACASIGKRWADVRGLFTGALVVWTLIALVASILSPGVSYLFTWPLLFAAAAALSSRGRTAAAWIAAAMTLLILAGFVYGVSVIMLGVIGVGAVALGVLASLVTLLLAPLLEPLGGTDRWTGPRWLAGAAVAVALVGVFTVRSSDAHPVPTALVYAENADSSDAWLGAFYGLRNAWTESAIGATTAAPAWTTRLTQTGARMRGRAVPRVPLEAPNAAFIRDTLMNGARRVVLRVTAPRGTTGLVMHARGAPVLTSSIDGRVVDTTRYRRHTTEWVMQYWAMPDTGAIVALSIPTGAKIEIELAARRPGIPVIPGVTIPARPPSVVPSQTGDVSIVYRRFSF